MRSIHITTARDLQDDAARIMPAAVLSIEHPGAVDGHGRAPRLNGTRQLIQSYWDIETPHPQAPTLGEIRKGLEFLKFHAGSGPLIVHCNSGRCRSVAMALGYLVVANPRESLDDIFAHLKTLRPSPAPNILVVRHLDTLLGLRGLLELAVIGDPVFSANRILANQARARYAEKNPGLFNFGPRPI